MARACTVCRHHQRNEIDRALIGGEQQAGISRRFRVAQSSLSRHLHNHLAPTVANAIGRYEEIDLQRLAAWSTGLYEEALLGMLRAKAEKNSSEARAWMAEARRNLELRSKLAGAIGDGPTVNIDARKQLAVLGNLGDDDLRTIVAAAREQLEQPATVEGGAIALPSPRDAVPALEKTDVSSQT